MKSKVQALKIDLSLCTGCKTCEIACKVEHSKNKEFFKSIEEKPPTAARIHVFYEDGYAIPITCRHCEDAACKSVCQAYAISKEKAEYPVLIEEENCFGCKCCIFACPFGAVLLDVHTATPAKCDLCADRQKRGKLPACIEGCPTGAIKPLSTKEISLEKQLITAIGLLGVRTQTIQD